MSPPNHWLLPSGRGQDDPHWRFQTFEEVYTVHGPPFAWWRAVACGLACAGFVVVPASLLMWQRAGLRAARGARLTTRH